MRPGKKGSKVSPWVAAPECEEVGPWIWGLGQMVLRALPYNISLTRSGKVLDVSDSHPRLATTQLLRSHGELLLLKMIASQR